MTSPRSPGEPSNLAARGPEGPEPELSLDLGFARLDLDRRSRQGFPEVVYGESKTAEQIETILLALKERGELAIATRVSSEKAKQILPNLPGFGYHDAARMLVSSEQRFRQERGVAIVAAGTSDLPVAEEARITCEAFGFQVDAVYDVGVAGLSRLLHQLERLRKADAVIVVAGMEGALPSVVGGLLACPVIAVPTSVGYGVGAGGVAALMGMLTSCATGLCVVNIDNGFGAAMAVYRILNRKEP